MSPAGEPDLADELTCEGCEGPIGPDQNVFVQMQIVLFGGTDLGVDPKFWHEPCAGNRPRHVEIAGVVA